MAYDRFRVDYEKGRFSMLQVEAIRQGSVVVTIAVTAVAVEILKATLLEDVKASWEKTPISKRTRKILDAELVPFFTKALPSTIRTAVTKAADGFKGLYSNSTGATIEIENIKVTTTESCDYLDVKLKLFENYDGTLKSYYDVVAQYNSALDEEQGMTTDEDDDQHLTTGLS